VLDIVLDEARVQKFFKEDIEFVEDLTDEVKTYRQNDGGIAVVIEVSLVDRYDGIFHLSRNTVIKVPT